MDLKQLQYFIAIAEEGSITKAAKRLHLTQPPLSQQLKKLEDELGTVLFERNSRNMILTDAGKVFLSRARQIVSFSNSAMEEIKDYSSGYSGTLLLGITPTAVPMIFSKDFTIFHDTYPSISLELYEGDTSYIEELLKKGIIDVGILRSPFNTHGLSYMEKAAEPMVAAMIPELNWSDCPFCSIRELDQKSVILYRRYEALLGEAFATHNAAPRIACKSERSYTALCAAKSGLGIALVPQSAVQMAENTLIYKQLKDPLLATKPMAIWLPNRYLSKTVQAFLDYFESL